MTQGRRTQRRKDGEFFANRDAVLDKIKVGRDGAILICMQSVVTGKDYQAARELVEATDKLAGRLTGDDTHFHIGSST